MSTPGASDAWSIDLMRKMLIENARTPAERAWAEAIPWQMLPTSDVVGRLIQGRSELEAENTSLRQINWDKKVANDRLFEDAELLRAENERLRAEAGRLQEANARLFAENSNLHRELCRLLGRPAHH